MLKKFKLRNYKNFKDTLVFNFDKVGGYQFNSECISNNIIGKSIIYGRNATGKTNLGVALMDIKLILGVVQLPVSDSIMLNADSNEVTAEFSYEFEFGGVDIIYEYSRKVNYDLVSESLNLNGESVFRLDYDKMKFEEKNLALIGAESLQLDKYMELLNHDFTELDNNNTAQVPFLRFILNNSAILPGNPVKALETFVMGMRFIGVNSQISITRSQSQLFSKFIDFLSVSDNNLMDFQEFLNIMGVKCELSVRKLPDDTNELYFNHGKALPFWKTASSGTRALTNMYYKFIFFKQKVPFVFLDEFDAFFHYEMAENLVKYFKMYCGESQIVMTTHNTNLMNNHLMRPDCLFILSLSGKLTALCDATSRELREGHNLEKLYIGGEFEAYE